MNDTSDVVLSSSLLKLGGKKQLGHKWQWRKCNLHMDCLLKYYDMKTGEYRGFINIEGSTINKIDIVESCYTKLSKLKHPKPPNGTNPISVPTFFCIKAKNCPKFYYFAVNLSEIDAWMTLLSLARSGPEKLKAKLKEKTELPTLLLHSSTTLSPRVDFSNEVNFREIDYENDNQFCDTISYITPPSSMHLIESPPLSSNCESPRSINSDVMGSYKYLHSGSISSGSTLSYRSSRSLSTNGSEHFILDTPRSVVLSEETGNEPEVAEIRSWSRCNKSSNQGQMKLELSNQRIKDNSMILEKKDDEHAPISEFVFDAPTQ